MVNLAVALAAPQSNHVFTSKVTPELQAAFQTKAVANIFVVMKEDTSSVIGSLGSLSFRNRSDRLNAIYSTLAAHADNSQKHVKSYLNSLKGLEYESLWINNQIYVRNASPEVVKQLELFQEVKSIDEEFFAHLIEPVESKNATVRNAENQWGIVKIQAPEAWREIGSNGGAGVRVATIDTGVRVTHEALKDNFFGDYGWYDPSTKEPLPTDRNGHGTHTTYVQPNFCIQLAAS